MAKYEPEYMPEDSENLEDVVYVRVNGKMERIVVPDDDAEPVDEED